MKSKKGYGPQMTPICADKKGADCARGTAQWNRAPHTNCASRISPDIMLWAKAENRFFNQQTISDSQ
jgi:hypothetical protein